MSSATPPRRPRPEVEGALLLLGRLAQSAAGVALVDTELWKHQGHVAVVREVRIVARHGDQLVSRAAERDGAQFAA